MRPWAAFLLISSLIFAAATYTRADSNPWQCAAHTFRYTENGIEQTNRREICTSPKADQFVSRSCRTQHCTAYDVRILVTMSDPEHTGVGSPGFALCNHLRGSPRIVRLELNGRWQPVSWCEFGGHDLVDLGTLQEFWAPRIVGDF